MSSFGTRQSGLHLPQLPVHCSCILGSQPLAAHPQPQLGWLFVALFFLTVSFCAGTKEPAILESPDGCSEFMVDDSTPKQAASVLSAMPCLPQRSPISPASSCGPPWPLPQNTGSSQIDVFEPPKPTAQGMVSIPVVCVEELNARLRALEMETVVIRKYLGDLIQQGACVISNSGASLMRSPVTITEQPDANS